MFGKDCKDVKGHEGDDIDPALSSLKELIALMDGKISEAIQGKRHKPEAAVMVAEVEAPEGEEAPVDDKDEWMKKYLG